jgi:hypothetical protein
MTAETDPFRAKQQRVPPRATFACRPMRQRREGRYGATLRPAIETGAKEARVTGKDKQALADAMREWPQRVVDAGVKTSVRTGP